MKALTHIISLPRCRTAWLSVAFTVPPLCYGFHDGIGNHSDNSLLSVDQYVAKLNARPEPFIVDCSSGIPPLPQYIDATNSQIIVILPDDEQACRESWIAHMGGGDHLNGGWSTLVSAFEACRQQFSSRIVATVMLSDISNIMPQLFGLCVPGAAVDIQRITALHRLNISERI